MSRIEDMLEHNRRFVEDNRASEFLTDKYPSKRIAVLSCMDTRLTALLPAALGFKNGEIKLIKNAGAVVTHPFGSVMRSLLVAVYELNVEDILVIGHHDCGMQGLEPDRLVAKMEQRGITKETLGIIESCGIDINRWLRGFDSVEHSVRQTVRQIREHPLVPSDVRVHGYLIDPETGRLDPVNVTPPSRS